MEVVVRAAAIYAILWILLRAMGKRELSEVTAFELVILVVLGDIIQQGTMQQDYSVSGAFLALAAFGFWITVMTYATWRWTRARRILEGVPIVLVADGKPIEAALAVEHMPLDEVVEAARQQGCDDISKIRLAVLEVSGRISIIQN